MVHGEIILDELGVVTDLMISSDSQIYFFELDKNMRSDYLIKDTRIHSSNMSNTRLVSDDYFAYPTELKEHKDNLIFATLSDKCLENTICDYQDIVLMSKENGSYKKIISHMKSAVHLSVVDDFLYVSESNGKIWRHSIDGNDATLLYEGENIIMDIAVSRNSVFWIEEINDKNSQILKLEPRKIPVVIASNLSIPYDITVVDNVPIWNEIQLKVKEDKIREHTTIQTHVEGQVLEIAEFENKTPISSTEKTVFGPYKTAGTYLFLGNNTSNTKNIHLLDLQNHENYLLENVTYDVRYFRNDDMSLYVVGSIGDTFLVDKIPLPVKVPEFPMSLIVLTSGFLIVLTAFSRRSFHN